MLWNLLIVNTYQRKVTYEFFFMDHFPLKSKTWCVRLIVGGDELDYELDAGSPTASLLESKLLINSFIYDERPSAHLMSLYLKVHSLAFPMLDDEFMRIP